LARDGANLVSEVAGSDDSANLPNVVVDGTNAVWLHVKMWLFTVVMLWLLVVNVKFWVTDVSFDKTISDDDKFVDATITQNTNCTSEVNPGLDVTNTMKNPGNLII
jgi:hypothetical protein